MNQTTETLSAPVKQPENKTAAEHELLQDKSLFKRLRLSDWVFAAATIAIAILVQIKLAQRMDIYETVILWFSAAAAIALGWFFKPLRWFMLGTVAAAYLAVGLYDGNIAHAGEKPQGKFLLRYLLSSQSAIMWQCALTVLAFFAYLSGSLALWRKQQKQPETAAHSNTLLAIGSGLAWAAAFSVSPASWSAGTKATCCVPMLATCPCPTYMKSSSSS